jgi:hypothetical protein
VAAVAPGHDEPAGPCRIVVRAVGGAPAPDRPAGGRPPLSLCVSAGPSFPLPRGARLYVRDLPGLVPGGADGLVAEVVANPEDPSVLGLKNCTRHTWSARMPGGASRQVEPGRSLHLQAGAAVIFGPVLGEIR